MKIIELTLEKWFSWRMAEKRVERCCDRLSAKYPQKAIDLRQGEPIHDGKAGNTIRVSCVQRRITPVKNIEEYIEILHPFIRKAAEENSQLVVFPEYNFFDLSGLIPGFRWISQYLEKEAVNQASKPPKVVTKDESVGKEGNPTVILFNALAEPVTRTVEKVCAKFAKTYGIYIYTGSYIAKEQGVLYNTGSLYGPDGQRIGAQKKLHLTRMERELGMGSGTDLQVYQLPIGNIAFPVCMDATYFETFLAARKLQADVVIIPIANAEEYNLWKALLGIWPRVQESYVYGLKASLNGWLIGMHYTGKAGVFAPLALTEKGDGVVAISKSHEGNELVTAEINLEKLREARATAEYYGDCNLAFERGYVERTYKGGCAGEKK